ncbi:MAG: HNH endonuclease, partial [Humibacter sp.]
PVDPTTAAATLRNAPSFHRVINDPIAPANLSLDRRSYRPSANQRRWLKLRYGLDDAATPFLAPDAEIDHITEYQHGGTTNITNLVPLKKRLHRLKSITKIRINPHHNGGMQVKTPTTHNTDPPPF